MQRNTMRSRRFALDLKARSVSITYDQQQQM